MRIKLKVTSVERTIEIYRLEKELTLGNLELRSLFLHLKWDSKDHKKLVRAGENTLQLRTDLTKLEQTFFAKTTDNSKRINCTQDRVINGPQPVPTSCWNRIPVIGWLLLKLSSWCSSNSENKSYKDKPVTTGCCFFSWCLPIFSSTPKALPTHPQMRHGVS